MPLSPCNEWETSLCHVQKPAFCAQRAAAALAAFTVLTGKILGWIYQFCKTPITKANAKRALKAFGGSLHLLKHLLPREMPVLAANKRKWHLTKPVIKSRNFLLQDIVTAKNIKKAHRELRENHGVHLHCTTAHLSVGKGHSRNTWARRAGGWGLRRGKLGESPLKTPCSDAVSQASVLAMLETGWVSSESRPGQSLHFPAQAETHSSQADFITQIMLCYQQDTQAPAGAGSSGKPQPWGLREACLYLLLQLTFLGMREAPPSQAHLLPLPSLPAPQISLRHTRCVQHPETWAARASAPHPGHHPSTYSSSKPVRSWAPTAGAAARRLIHMEMPPREHWQDTLWVLGKRECKMGNREKGKYRFVDKLILFAL